MVGISRSVSAAYAAAVLSVLAALSLTIAASTVFASTFYALFLCAVMFSAWYGGLLPGLFATLLSVLALDYYFIPPIRSWNPGSDDLIHLIAFICVALFISYLNGTRTLAEEALRRSHDELETTVQQRTAELHQLSGRLLHLRDEERRRISRELHETIAQSLVALKMDLSVLNRSTQARPEHEHQALAEALSLADECMRQARTLSYLLHPPLLDEAGLCSALRWYAEGLAQRSGMKIDLQLPNDLARHSQEVETAVFRIVQECLTNIHRHSGSAMAKIRIVQTPTNLLLEVQDEGQGMPRNGNGYGKDTAVPGVGIAGMHERVQQSGGHMEINSSSHGTTVKAVLPRFGAAS